MFVPAIGSWVRVSTVENPIGFLKPAIKIGEVLEHHPGFGGSATLCRIRFEGEKNEGWWCTATMCKVHVRPVRLTIKRRT